jgi:uncharacterized membrane protein YraQ (UPF0718 family)
MKFLKQYKATLGLLILILAISIYNVGLGLNIITVAGKNIKSLLLIIPPIFILIGLLDVWVPREVLIKHMGEDSGLKGIFYAFILGTLAVGPLYAAFPVAGLLLKKGVKYANVTFFLCTWMSTKIPLVLIETGSMGMKFTIIHIVTMLSIYLLGSFIIDKLLTEADKKRGV